MRSLGRRGIRVWMMDSASSAASPGMASRFGIPLAMPDIAAQPAQWLDKLFEIARSSPLPPIVIPTGDEHIELVSQYREQLRNHVRFRIPSHALATTLCNKNLQYELAERHSIPLPKTLRLDRQADIVRLAHETVGFPCLLKPYYSHRWRRLSRKAKLVIAHNPQELAAEYQHLLQSGTEFLLQEFIPGDDSTLYGYLAYYGANGQPLAAITKQKLRQYPPVCGNGSLQITVRNLQVAELSESLLCALKYQGLVSIEYKWDARDQKFKLIEINPRSVSGNQMAIDSGVDLPYILYQDLTDNPPPPTNQFTVGVKYLHFGWDLQAFIAQRQNKTLTTAQWLRSLVGVRSFALFSWRDSKPFVMYALTLLKQMQQSRDHTRLRN